MIQKIGFKCSLCNDIVYDRECMCGKIEVVNKDDIYFLITDDNDFETYTLYIDNEGKIAKVFRNFYENLGKDIIYPNNFTILDLLNSKK